MNSLDNSKPIKNTFKRHAQRQQMPITKKSTERKGDIQTRANNLIIKAKAHYQKHQQHFFNREYTKLLINKGQTLDYLPPGMSKTAQLKSIAAKTVHQRHQQRTKRIEQIRDRGVERSGRER